MTKYDAPALDKGLDILEFLSSQSIPQSQLEIANGISRKPNEIYRMLINLEKRGYIVKDPASGKFSLTLRLFHLAHHHSPVDIMVKASEMHMQNLAYCINQSVHLAVLHHNKLMIIAQVQSQTPVSLSVEIGSLFPLAKTVSGKITLAHLKEENRKQILTLCDDYQAMKASEKKALLNELQDIKKHSCICNKSMLTEGITDFAAPIFNMHQEMIAVLAVSTLTSQMRKLVTAEEIENEILKTVHKIRESLGIIK
ncbi:IclR family transcriptional regulator [Saccharicrinis fermentans]|uniref:IclR family transcriptional regulator n=1 Tax=Saccharicrinis fermentans TaxID=982 RepID=UPI00048662B6|nr:IclR family transcriptional regulator [Saccharicrinis fermentans]